MAETLKFNYDHLSLEELEEKKWDLVDELGAVNLAIASLKNAIKNKMLGLKEQGAKDE